ALVPDLLLSFKGSSYPQILEGLAQQIGDRSFAEQLTAALVKDRAALASADAFRSLIILTITFGLVWFMIKNKLNHQAGILLIAGVVLIDLWTVDKRYLNETRFVEPLQLNREFNALRQVDELILMDKNPN